MMAKIAHALIIAGVMTVLIPAGTGTARIIVFGIQFVAVLVLRLVLDAVLGAKKQQRAARQSYRPW